MLAKIQHHLLNLRVAQLSLDQYDHQSIQRVWCTSRYSKRCWSPSTQVDKNPKHKDDVLTNYQSKFGGDEPIVTTFQGKPPKFNLKPPSQYHWVKSSRMKPHKNKNYGLVKPIFRNVFVFLFGTYLTKMEAKVLASVSKLFSKVIPQISRLLKINWKPSVEPLGLSIMIKKNFLLK